MHSEFRLFTCPGKYQHVSHVSGSLEHGRRGKYLQQDGAGGGAPLSRKRGARLVHGCISSSSLLRMVTGSLPEGLTLPSRTSAQAFPVSCPARPRTMSSAPFARDVMYSMITK